MFPIASPRSDRPPRFVRDQTRGNRSRAMNILTLRVVKRAIHRRDSPDVFSRREAPSGGDHVSTRTELSRRRANPVFLARLSGEK